MKTTTLKTNRIATPIWRCRCCGAENDQRGCVKGPPNCFCEKEPGILMEPLRCTWCDKCPAHCRCNDSVCKCNFLKTRFNEHLPQGHSPKCRSRALFREKPHQAVAAALAELRAHWNAQYQDYVSKTDDSSWERRQELLDRMRELDATIAKLDLAICYEDRLPETLTDEQYNQWHASSWVQDAVRVGVSIEAVPASCTWTPDDDGNYATGCDGLFVILEGTPAENKMAYCCYCGKPIQEQPK